MKHLLLIGPYSATGGVSIHIRRLERLLADEFTINVIDESRPSACKDRTVFNLRRDRGTWWKYLGLLWWADVVHIHSGIFPLRVLHCLCAFMLRKRVAVTIHSLTVVKSRLSLALLRAVLRLADEVIFVSDEIKHNVGLEGLVVPAFIFPKMSMENPLSREIEEMLISNRSRKIVVSNAYRISLYNGEDLYGIDTLIEISRLAKRDALNIKIVFVIASLEVNKPLYEEYCRIIDAEGLGDYITLVPYPISFVRLIERSDLVVRATNTDGDALTVREALWLKKPVIASDASIRPEGAILFKTRDYLDLYEKIKSALSCNSAPFSENEIDHAATYRSIYVKDGKI